VAEKIMEETEPNINVNADEAISEKAHQEAPQKSNTDEGRL
jgi:hypothetical protein